MQSYFKNYNVAEMTITFIILYVLLLYTKDKILNSKNKYNANHLSRVVVEEDAFERKRKARQEEMEEME